MSSILSVTEENKAVSTFCSLVQEDQGFAFYILDYIAYRPALFEILFSKLNQQKEKYIKHVKEKSKNSKAMFRILNEMKENEAIRAFCSLLKESESFAFKVLDNFADCQHDLFEALFNKLDPQQKENYKIHLETKQTDKARLILGLFYPNNEKRLRIENFDTDSGALGQRRRSPEDEFSMSNNPSSSLNSTTLKEMVDQYGLDCKDPEFLSLDHCVIDEGICVEPAAKRQRIL